ncbi:MAG TPA: alkaline phosphatase family protein [Methylomirabilota bacterium]
MTLLGRRAWLSLMAGGAVAAASTRARSEPLTDPRIRHIVVVMLENRSFDHMLGMLMRDIPELRGVKPGDYFNVGKDGRRFYVTDGAEYQGQFTVDPPHEFENVYEQVGPSDSVPSMGGFASSYQRGGGNPANIMRCFRPEQLPALTALAKHYLVCDNWFSSVPGPTSPNRQFTHFGTSFGQLSSGIIWLGRGKGIYGRLDAAGRQGKIYYARESGTFGMTFLGSKYFGLYGDFVADCRSGNLPDYAFVEPSYNDHSDRTIATDQHPDHYALAGDQFIWDVYAAIRANDEVWRSTMLLIVWDEHGGIFDHVPPPTLPYGDGTPERPFRVTHPRFDFDRLGVRVGAVVVSPYVNPGVDHTLFEHASIPATVTQQFIGDPRDHAPFMREKNANRILNLLAPIPARQDWPDYKAAPKPRRARSSEGPASAFQLEHIHELHAALAQILPDDARALDPAIVKTKSEVTTFITEAMTALHARAGYA